MAPPLGPEPITQQGFDRGRRQEACFVALFGLDRHQCDAASPRRVARQPPVGLDQVTRREDGDPLGRNAGPHERREDLPERRPGVGVIVDHDDWGLRAAEFVQPPPLRRGGSHLWPDRQPRDVTPPGRSQLRFHQGREVCSCGSHADDRQTAAPLAALLGEPACQGDHVVVREVLAAIPLRNPQPAAPHPRGQVRSSDSARGVEVGPFRRAGRPAAYHHPGRRVHATGPAVSPLAQTPVAEPRRQRVGHVQHSAQDRDRPPEARHPPSDGSQFPAGPRQIVVNSARDAADQEVDVDHAFVPLPTRRKAGDAVQLLAQPHHLIVQGQDGIQTPGIAREKRRVARIPWSTRVPGRLRRERERRQRHRRRLHRRGGARPAPPQQPVFHGPPQDARVPASL